jgi:hypothetical protein
MNTGTLDLKFARMGARLKVTDRAARGLRGDSSLALDVQTDRKGEFFAIARPADADVAVLDVRPAERHLLLLVRQGGEKQKFLCGHDERHWFVAAIPEKAPVGTVRQAMEALKPAEVQAVQARQGLRAEARRRRKNAAYRRQGEWFFVPAPDLVADPKLVLRDEPITRGNGGKPHWAEFCYRVGGETVYVCRRHPNGLLVPDYRKLLQDRPEAKGWGWRIMARNPEVYVRGRISHADHRTITLHGWHKVLMNTETQARAMRNVAFLD